jgi:hypothetical protein
VRAGDAGRSAARYLEGYMEAKEYLEHLRGSLEGHVVEYTRLAANSLLIYVECEPGDKKGITIWFEPTWHLCGAEGVLLGSRQAQMDDAPEDEEAFHRVVEPLRVLEGKKLESVVVEPRTFDLHLFIEGDYWVKTFVADPTDEESWHIRENATGQRLKGSPKGIAIEPERTRTSG